MAESNSGINPQYVLYIGGGLLAYFGVIKPTLETLGIIDNADVKANKLAEVNENAWKPTFWQQAPSGALLITDAAVTNFTKLIGDAFGVLWDNYDTVMGVFQQMKTKSQVSYFADRFQELKGKGLYQFISGGNGGIFPWDGLSSKHLAAINAYVSSLPNYNV